MSFLHSVNAIFESPLHATGFLNEDRSPFDFKELLNESSNLRSAGVRALFTLQTIASIIALPIILGVGLLMTLLRTPLGEGAEAFKEMSNILTAHFLVGIPVSFKGIFMPLEDTKDYLTKRQEVWSEFCFDLGNREIESPSESESEQKKAPTAVTNSCGVLVGHNALFNPTREPSSTLE